MILNSNHPADRAQLAWLDGAFGDTGTKWRISFFHHPLYSSGGHAQQSRDSIRPALEPALVRNHVDVVFSGHEHLYERIAPQQGIRYFVSGAAAAGVFTTFTRAPSTKPVRRNTISWSWKSPETRCSSKPSHRKGERSTAASSGRTADAAAKPKNTTAVAWQDGCRVATAWRAPA